MLLDVEKNILYDSFNSSSKDFICRANTWQSNTFVANKSHTSNNCNSLGYSVWFVFGLLNGGVEIEADQTAEDEALRKANEYSNIKTMTCVKLTPEAVESLFLQILKINMVKS